MFKAELWFEGACIKKMPISRDEFRSSIRICKSPRIPLRYFNVGGHILNEEITVHVMNFEFVEQIDPFTLKYEFRYYEKPSEKVEDQALNLGFSEPDEKVNLDHLKKKMKNGLNIKGLLQRFYQK